MMMIHLFLMKWLKEVLKDVSAHVINTFSVSWLWSLWFCVTHQTGEQTSGVQLWATSGTTFIESSVCGRGSSWTQRWKNAVSFCVVVWCQQQRGVHHSEAATQRQMVAVSEAPRWAPAHRLMGRRCTPENTPLLTHHPCQSKKRSEVKVCVRRNCASYTLCLKSAAHQQWIFRTKRFNINFLHKWSKQHKSKQG